MNIYKYVYCKCEYAFHFQPHLPPLRFQKGKCWYILWITLWTIIKVTHDTNQSRPYFTAGTITCSQLFVELQAHIFARMAVQCKTWNSPVPCRIMWSESPKCNNIWDAFIQDTGSKGYPEDCSLASLIHPGKPDTSFRQFWCTNSIRVIFN